MFRAKHPTAPPRIRKPVVEWTTVDILLALRQNKGTRDFLFPPGGGEVSQEAKGRDPPRRGRAMCTTIPRYMVGKRYLVGGKRRSKMHGRRSAWVPRGTHLS